VVLFGDYNIELVKFSNSPTVKEALFTFSIVAKERKRFSDETIGVFLRSYFTDMGKWENMLCLKEALMKIGQELFEGIEFPFKYNIQTHTKFENIFSIHKIESPKLDMKTVQIKCKYEYGVEKSDFIAHMKNVEKWRSFNQNVIEFKKLLKQF